MTCSGQMSTTVTSAPPLVSMPLTYPPIPPQPNTRIRGSGILGLSAERQSRRPRTAPRLGETDAASARALAQHPIHNTMHDAGTVRYCAVQPYLSIR